MMNKIYLRTILNKIPYELFFRKNIKLIIFYVFGCKYFILINKKESLDKFDCKFDDDIFFGYSIYRREYRTFN